MARFMRLEVINTILETGLIPLFYNDDLNTAIEIVKACTKGGARLVEFTNRGEMAYPVFSGADPPFCQSGPVGHPGRRLDHRRAHRGAVHRGRGEFHRRAKS